LSFEHLSFLKFMPLITPFDPWHSRLCTCPAKYNLSPYTGCGHGCLYCYASSYIPRFGQPRPKKDFLWRLKKEIEKLPAGSTLTMANSSDPYTPQEKRLQLTRQTLKILAGHPVKLLLVTKSDLVLRDSGILKDLPAVVAVTVTTLNQSLAKRLEPGAPAPAKRLKALTKLSRNMSVAMRLDPVIPGLNESELETIVKAAADSGCRQVTASVYKARPDNLARLRRVFPLKRCAWEESERKDILERIKKLCADYKLGFATCREKFSGMSTCVCDGSNLLNDKCQMFK